MRADYFDNPLDYMPLNFVERPWYKNAKEKNDVVFTGTMLNAGAGNNDPIVVCSTPIHLNGEFIGVTGMGFFVKDVGEFSLSTSIGETGYCFLMNKNGQVIASPKEEGDLAVKSDFPDLRDTHTGSLTLAEEKLGNVDTSLALAAEKMTKGEKGSMFVTVDGEEYFLSFEPLQRVEWCLWAVLKV